MALAGKTPEQLKGGSGRSLGYLGTLLTSLVTAAVMAIFVNAVGAFDVLQGATAGFLLWLGFSATTGLVVTLFEGRSLKLYGINAAYNLISFVVMGSIIAIV